MPALSDVPRAAMTANRGRRDLSAAEIGANAVEDERLRATTCEELRRLHGEGDQSHNRQGNNQADNP